MKYCHYLFVALGITSAAILASCQDEDFGYTSDQIAYRTNFEKTFGKVSDIPTWDFSSYNLARLGLAGGPGASGMTRASYSNPGYTGRTDATPASDNSYILASNQAPTGLGLDAMTDDYYKVEPGTLSWLDTNLKEGEQDPLNVTKGQSFVLGKPTDNFAIIPIYQGHAGMCWDLHLVDKGTNTDYTIWSKSQGIQYFVDFNDNVLIEVRHDDIVEYDHTNHKDVISFNDIYFEDYDCDGDLELTITLPANRNLKGKFENNNGDILWEINTLPDGCSVSSYTNSSGNTEYEYFFNNKDNSSAKAFTLKFSKDNEKSWIQAKGIKFWVHENHVTWNDHDYYKCYFKYYEDISNRILVNVKYNKTKWVDLETSNNHGKELSNEAGHTVKRHAVQAKPIVIDKSKITGDFYLYLKITQEDPDNGGASGYGVEGSCQRSDEHMMVALPCTQPTNIGRNEYMIIGCEDSNTALSDWDVNDIVFLCVGQGSLPKVQEVVAAKRYMIEDLGSTFDFDFNDIVVDVTQYRYKNYLGNYLDNSGDYSIAPSNVANAKTITKASLKHLCGTIPFKIQIGSTILGTGKYDGCNEGCDPEGDGCDPTTHGNIYKEAFDCEIEGWDPAANNIAVTTWPKQAGTTGWNDNGNDNYLGTHPDGGSSFSFPTKGQFPYIIACDQTVMWMKESVNVPRSWFSTWPTEYPNNPGIHNQGTNPEPEPEAYGTEINFTADGRYGANVTLGKILSDKTSITLTFVPQNNNTFSFKGCIGGSYLSDEDWIWQQTSQSINVNCSDGSSAVEVTLNLNNEAGDNIVRTYGIGSTYDATLALWSDVNNEIYIGGTKVTKDNITDNFVNSKIKVYYK